MTGFHVHPVHQERWPSLASTTALGTRIGSAWLDWCRRWVAGDGTAAIWNINPWQRGTLFDLHATSVQWGLPLIEAPSVYRSMAMALCSRKSMVSEVIWQQILNRLILNEKLTNGNNFVSASRLISKMANGSVVDLVQKGVMAEIDYRRANLRRVRHLVAESCVYAPQNSWPE